MQTFAVGISFLKVNSIIRLKEKLLSTFNQIELIKKLIINLYKFNNS